LPTGERERSLRPVRNYQGELNEHHTEYRPLVSLIAGILILIVPRMLNYIVAIYLIIIGLLGLFGANIPHLR
jgi:Protein of unknown function (DUF3096)